MPAALRGEVWIVDLGMAAKIRPVLILNIPFSETERALFTIIPHTTAIRGGRFEVIINVPWLLPGGFDVQGLRQIPRTVLIRKLGVLSQLQMDEISRAVRLWLAL